MLSLDFIKEIKRFSRRIELVNHFESEENNVIPDLYYLMRDNPAARHLLPKRYFTRDYDLCVRDPSRDPKKIRFIDKYPNRIHWFELSLNPAAIHILEKNLDKVNWKCLSGNPAAIGLLEKNLDEVVWYELAVNIAAIDLIENNRNRFRSCEFMYLNPSCINMIEK